jgi:hypothetical protein
MLSRSYIAGFIDGEGYVGIHRHKVNRTAAIRVSIAQKRPLVLEMIQQQHGGYIRSKTRKGWRWSELQIYGFQAYEILRKTRAFMVVKREEANFAMKFYREYNKEDRMSEDRIIWYHQTIKDMRDEESRKSNLVGAK